ncbi:hypothetical protein QOT17_004520 [Balamuthia mandrillaris]
MDRVQRIVARQQERERRMREKEAEQQRKEAEKRDKVVKVYRKGSELPVSVSMPAIAPKKTLEQLELELAESKWKKLAEEELGPSPSTGDIGGTLRSQGKWQRATEAEHIPPTDLFSPLERADPLPHLAPVQLDSVVSTTRWHKDDYGWARRDQAMRTIVRPPPTTSAGNAVIVNGGGELMGGGTALATPTSLPAEVYMSLNISKALKNADNFCIGCKLLSLVLEQWYGQLSNLSAQNMIYKDLNTVHGMIASQTASSDYAKRSHVLAALDTFQSAVNVLREILVKSNIDERQQVWPAQTTNLGEWQEPENVAEENKEDHWTCQKCTFVNYEDMERCDMCQRSREEQEKAERRERELRRQEQVWQEKNRKKFAKELKRYHLQLQYAQEQHQALQQILLTNYSLDIYPPKGVEESGDISFFCKIPDEILLQIFVHLDCFQDIKACSLVCKQFYRIVSDDLLYKLLLSTRSQQLYSSTPPALSPSLSSTQLPSGCSSWKQVYLLLLETTNRTTGTCLCSCCGQLCWRFQEQCANCAATEFRRNSRPLPVRAVMAILLGQPIAQLNVTQ